MENAIFDTHLQPQTTSMFPTSSNNSSFSSLSQSQILTLIIGVLTAIIFVMLLSNAGPSNPPPADSTPPSTGTVYRPTPTPAECNQCPTRGERPICFKDHQQNTNEPINFKDSPWFLKFKPDWRLYSQDGGDGILTYILTNLDSRLGNVLHNGYYVEFGVEDGQQCNSRYLRQHLGWKGLMMDGGYVNPAINLQKEYITSLNIIDLFKKHKVPQDVTLISIDIDYDDYFIFQTILEDNYYRPLVFVVEYNRNFRDARAVDPSDSRRWIHDQYYGGTTVVMNDLAKKYGYTLITCSNDGVNLFFVRDDASKYLRRDMNGNPLGSNHWEKIYDSCSTAPLHAPEKDLTRKWLRPGKDGIIKNPLKNP